jgi:hypothetical protein
MTDFKEPLVQDMITEHTALARTALAAVLSYAYGDEIDRNDLHWTDGSWTLDGMEPSEWIESMMTNEEQS